MTPAIPKYDVRSVIAAGLCLSALFFDTLGWLLGIIGIFLLRRSVFQPTIKWILAALALAPKILFLGVRTLTAPAGLFFTFEPRTLATSESLWVWSILLAGFGVFLFVLPGRLPRAPNAPVEPSSGRTVLLRLAGLAAIVLAAAMLLGLGDGFHRIDDAGNGRWALVHAARGAVATFARDELASIEATENRASRSGTSYFVRLGLTNGRSFSVSTKWPTSLDELRKFATTANLKPGTVRIQGRFGHNWTNGASGFTLRDCIGTYQYAGQLGSEHSTFEFWLDGARLAGKETLLEGQSKYVRPLRNIKISDTGEVEFEQGSYAEAGESSKTSVSFSLRWTPDGERGRFTKDGLEIGLKKYRKL